MTEVRVSDATRIVAGDGGAVHGIQRYDSLTIGLHWLTAILVATLSSLAHIWPA